MVNELDLEPWSFLNLLPTNASETQLWTNNYLVHMKRILMECCPAILSFDKYPVPERATIRSDYHRDLENIRQVVMEYDTPFWHLL